MRLRQIGVGYQESPALFGRQVHDEVWTNWYREKPLKGILKLAYMRERLNRENLVDTHPPDVLTDYAALDVLPPTGVGSYRTLDGSWNAVWAGAARS